MKDYSDKVHKLEDLKIIRELSNLPLKYTLKVTRTKPNKINGPDWDEEIKWSLSQDLIDNEYGELLFFNHLLTILDSYTQVSDKCHELLMQYIDTHCIMEVPGDSDFNK